MPTPCLAGEHLLSYRFYVKYPFDGSLGKRVKMAQKTGYRGLSLMFVLYLNITKSSIFPPTNRQTYTLNSRYSFVLLSHFISII